DPLEAVWVPVHELPERRLPLDHRDALADHPVAGGERPRRPVETGHQDTPYQRLPSLNSDTPLPSPTAATVPPSSVNATVPPDEPALAAKTVMPSQSAGSG